MTLLAFLRCCLQTLLPPSEMPTFTKSTHLLHIVASGPQHTSYTFLLQWNSTHFCYRGPLHIFATVDLNTLPTHFCFSGPQHIFATVDLYTFLLQWTSTHFLHIFATVDLYTFLLPWTSTQFPPFFARVDFNPLQHIFTIVDLNDNKNGCNETSAIPKNFLLMVFFFVSLNNNMRTSV